MQHDIASSYASPSSLPLVEITSHEALAAWRDRANRGDAAAQFQLGYLHFSHRGRHIGLRRDFQRARRWLEAAARQGHAEAQFHLGLIFQHGLGVRRRRARAFRWFARAAANGHREAARSLPGTCPNPRRAARWLLRAARAGDVEAMEILALAPRYGLSRDTRRSWLREARDRGGETALRMLGPS